MDSAHLHEGMVVYGSHGEKLGKIVGRARETFVIERGTFFPKEYVARCEDVAEISGDEVRLTRGEEALGLLEREASAEGPLGEVSPTNAGGGVETVATEADESEPGERGAGSASGTAGGADLEPLRAGVREREAASRGGPASGREPGE